MTTLDIILIAAGILCLSFLVFIAILAFRTSETKEKEEDTFRHADLKRKRSQTGSLYACVNWPDIQFLMGRSGFLKNAVLIRTLAGEDVDSTYMVPLFLFKKGEETGMLYKGFSFPESQKHENNPDAGVGYNGMVFIPTKTTVYPAEK